MSDVPDCLTGYLLISEADLSDPNFYRSVVLLIDHGDTGAFGIVLNRRSDTHLGEAVPLFAESVIRDQPIYVGGPVEQDRLFVIHSGVPDNALSAYHVTPCAGVVFEPAVDVVAGFLDSEWMLQPPAERTQARFYAGYAGWGPGQLESELATDSWVVLPADVALVFAADSEHAWKTALSKKGGLYQVIAETGFRPSMN